MISQSLIIVLLSVVLAAVAAYAVVQWLFKKDTEVEKRRHAAFHLASTLKGLGLVRIPDFLGDYAVGDYSGMFEKIHDLAKLVLSGEEAVLAEFKQVFDRLLEAKMGSAEGRAYLAAKLAEAAKPAGPAPSVTDLKTPTPS